MYMKEREKWENWSAFLASEDWILLEQYYGILQDRCPMLNLCSLIILHRYFPGSVETIEYSVMNSYESEDFGNLLAMQGFLSNQKL